MTQTAGVRDPSVADRVAAAVRAVPGVADLHPGPLGQIGTLLPGRRVDGVRIGPQATEVHVSATMGTSLTTLADALVAAVHPITGTRVDVVVEDIVGPDDLPTIPSSTEDTP